MVTRMTSVEFHFDFGSPNAHLAHRVILAIEARTGVRFRYVPVLLGGVFKATDNRSPAETLRGIKNKPEYERLETERFIRRHQITQFRRNPFFPVNTLQVMRGAVAAEIDGSFAQYVEIVFHHMWEEPKKDGRSRRDAQGAGRRPGWTERALSSVCRTPRSKNACRATPSNRWRAAPLVRLLSLSGRRFSLARIACARSRRRSCAPLDPATVRRSSFGGRVEDDNVSNNSGTRAND
jgi:2-hydroxychromene-2-carboxylate isomerase